MSSASTIPSETIWSIFSLNLSDKLKFSIKASLSLALVVLISFAMGWTQSSVAMVTIMIIASVGSVGDSVSKGILRIVGTVIGATLGITLIAIFPQDRMLYLLWLSIFVTITLYLTRAYQGDNSAFMLTAVTMMMVFQNGSVENSFLYSIDKTFMTVFGITIYTLVGIFLWPVNTKDTSKEDTLALLEAQKKLFDGRDDTLELSTKLWQDLIAKEQTLREATLSRGSNTIQQELSDKSWQTILSSNRKLNEQLLLLSHRNDKSSSLQYIIKNYDKAVTEIETMFQNLLIAVNDTKEVEVASTWKAEYDREALIALSHLERASVVAMGRELSALHQELIGLTTCLNRAMSPIPDFDTHAVSSQSSFIWWDSDHLKGSLLSFIIFWVSTGLWIYFNPPGGFLIVTLATAMSVLTTFSPVKPSALMIVFSIAFFFAALSYIAVLPQLRYGWELGLFIFFYGFIGFYLIPPKLSLFFLLGMMTLGLNNEMSYNMDIFLLILFVFYAFLSILLLFYYIPFSTKAQDLFIANKNRFFTLANNLSSLSAKNSLLDRYKSHYSKTHLLHIVTKMKLWAEHIDTAYYDTVDSSQLQSFVEECERLAHLLLLQEAKIIRDNPLAEAFLEQNRVVKIEEVLASHITTPSQHYDRESQKELYQKSQDFLDTFFSTLNYDDYTLEEIASFYESINLRKSIWISLFRCEEFMEQIDFKGLKISSF